MTIFYWVMGIAILGTLSPAVMLFAIYALTGRQEAANKARVLWNVSRVFTLFGLNLLIWGHVVVGLWQLRS